MVSWIAVAVSTLVLGLLTYWLLQITEGAYLGSGVVALLYDWSASRYDIIKGFSNTEESWFLARPLLNRLAAVPRPLVLDVATGTARLPYAVFREESFRGQIVALDLSRRMLEEAVLKTERHADRILLLHQDATLLPFPDASFDAVTCLEALEFLPHARQTIREMTRVLRPGGVLLTTNRRGWESKLFPGRAYARHELVSLLKEMGLTGVTVQSWQYIYDLVWSRKPGDLLRGRPTKSRDALPYSEEQRGLSTHVSCPQCREATLCSDAAVLHCPSCRTTYPVEGRIVALTKPSRAKTAI